MKSNRWRSYVNFMGGFVFALCLLQSSSVHADIRIDKARLSFTQITGVNATIAVFFKVCFISGTKSVKVTTYHSTSSTSAGSIVRASRQYSTNKSCIDDGISMAFGKDVEKGTNHVHVVFEQTGGQKLTRVLPITVTGNANIGFNGVPTISTTSAKAGDEVTITYKLKNSGVTRSKTTSEVKILYSFAANDVIDPSKAKRYVTSGTVPKLDALTNSTVAVPILFKVPPSVRQTSGSLHPRVYLSVFIDPDKKLDESSRGDNYKTFTINYQLPDVKFSFVRAAPNPIPEKYVNDKPTGQFDIEYCLENNGTGDSSGTVECEVSMRDKQGTITQPTFNTKVTSSAISIPAKRVYCSAIVGKSLEIKIPEKAVSGFVSFLCKFIPKDDQDVSLKDNEDSATATLEKWFDYSITKVETSASTVQTGKSYTVTTTVKNVGNNTQQTILLNITFVYQEGGQAKQVTLKQSVLVPGTFYGTRTFNTQVTIPANLSSPAGFIVVKLEPSSITGDRNSNNNTENDSVFIVTDKDKDGVTSDKDCNDNNAAIKPGATEVCDGVDNNCNQQIDEGCACKQGEKRECYTGQGCTYNSSTKKYTCKSPCKAGTQTCTAGKWGACTGEKKPSKETCNGVDDDCDGSIDENIPPAACFTDLPARRNKGECKDGTRVCKNGKLSTCQNEVKAKAELCDGKDNDCDGQTDEDFTKLGQPCSNGTGACKRTGKFECNKGGTIQVCSAIAGKPTAEVCNNLDDNCDGMIDNNIPIKKCYTGPAGTKGVGLCKEGNETCGPGGVVTCKDTKPAKEICDNKDNDCNGQVDDNITQTCFDGPGAAGIGNCKSGTKTCKAGKFGACVGQVVAKQETCDGNDENCNGAIDEGVSRACYTGPTGTSGKGLCKKGIEICSAGKFSGLCVGEVKPEAEVCDGQDNDCNGQIDDAPGCSSAEEATKPDDEAAEEASEEPASQEPTTDASAGETSAPDTLKSPESSEPDTTATPENSESPEPSKVGPEKKTNGPETTPGNEAKEEPKGVGCDTYQQYPVPLLLFMMVFLFVAWHRSHHA